MKFGAIPISLLLLGIVTSAAAEDVQFVGITQVGANNSASINQAESADARVSLIQLGESNGAEAEQAGDAEAVLLQSGRGNTALLRQQARSGGSAEAWLYQTGDQNNAALFQDGAGNRALATQVGEANLLELTQVSDDNAAVLMQEGVGLALLVTQTGGSDITITQRGP